MSKRCKVRVKLITALPVLLLLFFMTFTASAQKKPKQPKSKGKNTTITVSDTMPKKSLDSTKLLLDSTGYRRDSTGKWQKIDTIAISKDSLDAPIDYTADDSAIIKIPNRQFYLYGKASVNYNKDKLEANTIHYDQPNQIMNAYGGKDTSKNPLNLPTFTQGDTKAISDTIRYNIKTGRGLTKNSYYQEGEMYVYAQKLKKEDKDVSYGWKTRFTTCNLDTPHFAFLTKRVKLINDKFAVTGPAWPEFEGVPMPVALPFGIFPLTKGRHSGLLAPAFANNNSYGLGLEGLGYYKVLSDNWDLTTRANIYTYGGWAAYFTSKYTKRYKYTGSVNLSILKTKILNSASTTAADEFTESSNFQIQWSHSADSRARPGTTFSANVNAGSTKYNSYVPNSTVQNYTNQMSSSISYSKTWGNGKYNLTASANHSQNNNLRLISVTLPTLAFTATTIYPFQKKEQIGTPKWYQKLGISYSGSLLNQLAFYDSAFSWKQLLDTTQWGATHSIPITLTLPAVGPLIFSPSISYSEKWYGNSLLRTWDPVKDTVLTHIQRGFQTAREVTFGISTNTRIFGTFNLGKNTKLRHEIKPTFSLNYKPDLVGKYYYNLVVDSTAKHAAYTSRLSKFEGSVVGGYSEGQFGGFNFGFDNLFEMKTKNNKDTTGENPYKKIKLIDGLSFNTGYNFFADSLKWSTVAIAFRSTLFEKINITGSATLDPYNLDSAGNRINDLLWKRGSLGRFTGGSLSVSSSFQSKKTDQRSDADRLASQGSQTMTPDEQQRTLDYMRANPAEFTDFNIPWTLQTSLSLNFTRLRRADYSGYYTSITSSLNLNGDFSLTPKWKLGGSMYFDIKNTKVQTMTMYVSREMHCWQMSINVTPIGIYKSFNITLNPKSSILRDLKVNRSRSFYTP